MATAVYQMQTTLCLRCMRGAGGKMRSKLKWLASISISEGIGETIVILVTSCKYRAFSAEVCVSRYDGTTPGQGGTFAQINKP